MRDLLHDLIDHRPMEAMDAARRAMRQPLPKRFYAAAEVAGGPDGFEVRLDGKPVRTPSRALLALPTSALADAVAAEWRAQGQDIDPATMPLTRLAHTVIDGVRPDPAAVRAEIVKYAGSDLVCYRAAEPEGLVARQLAAWDPVLAFARVRYGAAFVTGTGVMFVEQPEAALAGFAAGLPVAEPAEAFRLGALASMTTLTGSALIAAMVGEGALSLADAWAAAHVDEDWNIAQWGDDPLALACRTARLAEMEAAAAMAAMA